MMQTDLAQYEVLELVREKLRVAGGVSSYVTANADARVEWDHLADRLVAEIQSHVWRDPSRSYHRVLRFEEAPVFASWRHQLVASLPLGSVRRRFLAYLWGIPEDEAGSRVAHEVTVDVPALFPEASVAYPPELGRLSLPVMTTERAWAV